jgi:hypothetical protein
VESFGARIPFVPNSTVQLAIFGRHTKHDRREVGYASNNDLSKLHIEWPSIGKLVEETRTLQLDECKPVGRICSF